MARLSSVFFILMQYNSNATGQDIVTMSEKKSLSNSVSFPIAEKTLYANEGSKIIWGWIHEAYGGWAFDDSNQTDFPEATTQLTSGQVDYLLPVDADAIKGVSIKNQGAVWYDLEPITLEQIQDQGFSEAQFMNVASTPIYYRLLGNSVKIYPAANYTQAASLKIWENREILLFTTTDTTKTPGWITAFHEALATYMALQYARINGTPQAGGILRGGFKTGLNAEWSEWEMRIKKYYSRRFAEMFPPRITVRDYTRENQ